MALETCPHCATSYEINRHGTREVRQSVDADGNAWHVVTSDTWVVHQCLLNERVVDTRTHTSHKKEHS
jgi:hypothetical protein